MGEKNRCIFSIEWGFGKKKITCFGNYPISYLIHTCNSVEFRCIVSYTKWFSANGVWNFDKCPSGMKRNFLGLNYIYLISIVSLFFYHINCFWSNSYRINLSKSGLQMVWALLRGDFFTIISISMYLYVSQ